MNIKRKFPSKRESEKWICKVSGCCCCSRKINQSKYTQYHAFKGHIRTQKNIFWMLLLLLLWLLFYGYAYFYENKFYSNYALSLPVLEHMVKDIMESHESFWGFQNLKIYIFGLRPTHNYSMTIILLNEIVTELFSILEVGHHFEGFKNSLQAYSFNQNFSII